MAHCPDPPGGWGPLRSRQHRWRNRQDQLTWPDGSTNSWRHARTRDQSLGGLYSYNHGPSRRWTSMRDTCRTSSSDRPSLVDNPPRQSCRTTCRNYTVPNSRHRTCDRPSRPAECLRKWELQIPLCHGPFGDPFGPRTAVASSKRGAGTHWQPSGLWPKQQSRTRTFWFVHQQSWRRLSVCASANLRPSECRTWT